MNSVKRKYKRGEIAEILLDSLADNLMSMKSYPGPSLFVVLGGLLKLVLIKRKENLTRSQILRSLENLEKKEIIAMEEKRDKVIIHILDKGRITLLEYSLSRIFAFKKEKKEWKGKWYLVFFDVPEIQRNKRDYLRRLLTKMGFYRFQKSVYVLPYECEEEIKLIKKIVEGAKYMKYIIAEKIEDEERVKTYFRL